MFNYIKNKLQQFTEKELLTKEQRAYLCLYETGEISIEEVLQQATQIEDYDNLKYFLSRVRDSDELAYELAFKEALKKDKQPFTELSNRMFLGRIES